MVLRIETFPDVQVTILRLSGRLQSEHLDQLKAQLEASAGKLILDLDEVKLVDREVVRFLGVCESNGVEVSRCPLYIREWINREKASQPDS